MRCAATYHAADDNHRVKQTRLYQLRCREREFDRSGHCVGDDILTGVTELLQTACRSFGKRCGDERVPFGGDYGNP